MNKEEVDSIHNEVTTLIALKQPREATEMIVEYIKNNNYIYTTKDDQKSEMWIYRGGIYVPQGRSCIKEMCREILGQLFTTHMNNEICSKIEADTFIDQDVFFSSDYPDKIPVLNGILDIQTLEISPHDPEKIFFSKIPVTYNNKATCPMIDKFLSDVLSKEDDKLVFYELAGFGLLKDYRYEKAVMMVGDGRNGKGKSIELLKRLVGAENCAGIPLHTLTTQSFAVSELFGKFFNLAGDLSPGALKETGIFKSLTGRDQISAPRKFLRDVIFINHAKMVFACNELPRVYDASVGFWERWLLLEFPYRFVDKDVYDATNEDERRLWKIKDEMIIEKITTPEEMSGFLNLALKGLKRLLSSHRFSYSRGTEDIKNTWIRKADSFMAFCLDNIEEEYNGQISKKEIRKKYNDYCKYHKVSGRGDKSIKITLQELFGVTDEYLEMLGVREWYWSGIKFKNLGV